VINLFIRIFLFTFDKNIDMNYLTLKQAKKLEKISLFANGFSVTTLWLGALPNKWLNLVMFVVSIGSILLFGTAQINIGKHLATKNNTANAKNPN